MGRDCSVLVLAAGDNEWRPLLDILAQRFEYRVFATSSVRDASSVVERDHVDLALAEDAPALDGCGFLAGLRTSHPNVMRVAILDEAATHTGEAVSRAAVYQFLRAPLDAEQAGLVVKRALEARELSRRHRLLSREFKIADGAKTPSVLPPRAQSQRFEKLVYVSEKMVEVCQLARTAAATDLPVLVEGETGTGKELLARAIHFNSKRRASPLLAQNCGGVPEQFLQSELFGHQRGAFTGAISDRLGLFKAADGGTVFLDEISEVSPSFQASLLRFLQEGEIKPLGSDRTTTSDVRIIAASNRSLPKLVASGEFRRDLYYRLKGFEFVLPPLRERPDDVPALAEFFAAKHGEAVGRKPVGISASVMARLTSHSWPGNVRELEGEIRRMVAITRNGEYLTQSHLSPELLTPPHPTRRAAPGKTLKERVESLERQVVNDALSRHHWNQSRAADELGLSRVGLANKIKRYGLDKQTTP